MTIRNLEAYIAALWDWIILKGCFGMTKIEPTDVDGFVEHNGHFLILEAKGPGKPLSKGQRIAFENLQKTGLFTVVVVWGNPGIPEKLLVFAPRITKEFCPADLDVLRDVVTQWFTHSCRHRPRGAA